MISKTAAFKAAFFLGPKPGGVSLGGTGIPACVKIRAPGRALARVSAGLSAGLKTGAYDCPTVRGGLQTVPRGNIKTGTASRPCPRFAGRAYPKTTAAPEGGRLFHLDRRRRLRLPEELVEGLNQLGRKGLAPPLRHRFLDAAVHMTAHDQ